MMPLNLNTLAVVEKLILFTVVLQALEMLSIRFAWSGPGPWQWSISRLGLPNTFAWLLNPFLSDRNFGKVLHLQLVVAAFGLIFPADFPFVFILLSWLAFGTLLIGLRFRGTFNGAADSMTFWILVFIAAALAAPALSTVFIKMIAALVVASFFISGVAKLRDVSWRAGSAIYLLARVSNYRDAVPPSQWLNSRVLTWSVIAFEISFPLCLIGKPVALAYIIFALIFHIINFRVFGLNRFFFAWLSAYPAVYYCA